MKSALLAIATLAYATPALGAEASTDQAGNVYPAACTTEATQAALAQVPHFAVAPDSPMLPIDRYGRHALGATWTFPTSKFVVVSNGLAGWKLADAWRHEGCHLVAGDNWHGSTTLLSP